MAWPEPLEILDIPDQAHGVIDLNIENRRAICPQKTISFILFALALITCSFLSILEVAASGVETGSPAGTLSPHVGWPADEGVGLRETRRVVS